MPPLGGATTEPSECHAPVYRWTYDRCDVVIRMDNTWTDNCQRWPSQETQTFNKHIHKTHFSLNYTSHILYYECWTQSWSRFFGSQPAGDLVINLVVGCHYFPPCPRLLFQPKRLLPLAGAHTAWWQRHAGVSSLPKATMQWCPANIRTRHL